MRISKIDFMNDTGYHYTLEIKSAKHLDDGNWLENFFRTLLDSSQFNILNFVSHRFKGGGITGIFLLSESHLSYHTYPENNYMSIDLYTCGNNPSNEINKIIKYFGTKNVICNYVKRGSLMFKESFN